MIFISKMIRDPNGFIPRNKMGLTVGLTFHTPKFWNCKEIHPEQWRHPTCTWPHRHMSYRGYAYWTGPRRRYQFNYMGNPTPGRRGLFTVVEHGRYTRWLEESDVR